jgi:hypothetical protein
MNLTANYFGAIVIKIDLVLPIIKARPGAFKSYISEKLSILGIKIPWFEVNPIWDFLAVV